MATVFTANSSGILVDNTKVDGVRSIEYQVVRDQSDVHALGSPERIAVYYGASRVKGRIVVASACAKLDELVTSGASFPLLASLKHGQSARSVAFDECYMLAKSFAMATGGHGEMVYEFSATRVREEDSTGDKA